MEALIFIIIAMVFLAFVVNGLDRDCKSSPGPAVNAYMKAAETIVKDEVDKVALEEEKRLARIKMDEEIQEIKQEREEEYLKAPDYAVLSPEITSAGNALYPVGIKSRKNLCLKYRLPNVLIPSRHRLDFLDYDYSPRYRGYYIDVPEYTLEQYFNTYLGAKEYIDKKNTNNK